MKKENNINVQDKIKEMIENIRPYLNMDGGDIEFVKYDDNIVYVKLTGACSFCLGQDDTLNEGILKMFQEELPEIKVIINLTI